MGQKVNRIDSYRMDNRSVEQFARDIQRATRTERAIIERYVLYYEKTQGHRLTVEDAGCDNTGKLLSYRQVNSKADFKLDRVPVEVKFNNQHLCKFRFKAEQLESYLKQGAIILWANGWDTQDPVFTLLGREDLEQIKRECPLIAFEPWGGKMCFEVHADDLEWMDFNERGED